MPYSGGVESVYFLSGDTKLVGVLYPAVGEGARPTAILLHGMPGSEKNLDIAYRLRELGWHTFLPHFRGSWGSAGDFDLTRQPDDTIAAIDYLLNTPSVCTVEPSLIALVGYSFGSRAAIVAAHRDSRVGAVVSIAGVADFDDLLMSEAFFDNATHFLHGVSRRDLQKQWSALGGQENPMALVGKLRQRFMISHGTQDEIVPFFMAPALYDASHKRATLALIEGADHTFTQHRAKLVLAVTTWLDRWARGD